MKLRAAFTLIEMIVVILIITALAGISYPVFTSLLSENEIDKTRFIVQSVTSAISSYDNKTFLLQPTNAVARRANRFDIDDNAILDGDPDKDTDLGTLLDGQAYEGFLEATGLPIDAEYIDDKGQVTDTWGFPLIIDFNGYTISYDGGETTSIDSSDPKPEKYGTTGFGVFSIGPDGEANTDDDICSWKNNDD